MQDELPPWFTPYPFVLTSYRSGFSYRLCLASLFRLHNETLNVWSELAPAACFALWMVRRPLDQQASPSLYHPHHPTNPHPTNPHRTNPHPTDPHPNPSRTNPNRNPTRPKPSPTCPKPSPT